MLMVSESLFNFQTKMMLSSSPEARYSPDGDQRTTLTGRWCLVRFAAISKLMVPASVCVRYHIYKDRVHGQRTV